MRRTRFDRVRIYETLRSAHLERANDLRPSSILYKTRRYDFDPDLAGQLDLHQGGFASTAWILARSTVTTMEINEPLMRTGVRRSLLALAVVRAQSFVRRRSVEVVCYAIENRDPFQLPASAGVRARWRSRLDRVYARLTATGVDRIAFGTDGSQELYATMLGRQLDKAMSSVFPALPSPCTCVAEAPRDPDLVVFLGGLIPRKGFPNLMAAWPGVISAHPTARLLIVGKGTMEATARQFAADEPTVEVAVDPPRAQIHQILRRAAVMVLPSQPDPIWREQVGLPIVEALAHGCTVVTTTETGLAHWLRDHGHQVVPTAAGDAAIARAIGRALTEQRAADSVVADLPAADGRLEADRWLFGDDQRATQA